MEARLANVLHLVDAAGNGKVHAVRGDDHRDSGEIHILRHSMVCIKKGKKVRFYVPYIKMLVIKLVNTLPKGCWLPPQWIFVA